MKQKYYNIELAFIDGRRYFCENVFFYLNDDKICIKDDEGFDIEVLYKELEFVIGFRRLKSGACSHSDIVFYTF